MADFRDLLGLDELVPGRGRCVAAGRRELAIFRVEPASPTDAFVFAIANDCPHRGGPLSEGDLAGCVVYCPLHAWGFDLRTGISPSNPRTKVETYPVRVVGGRVEVLLPDEAEAPAVELFDSGPPSR